MRKRKPGLWLAGTKASMRFSRLIADDYPGELDPAVAQSAGGWRESRTEQGAPSELCKGLRREEKLSNLRQRRRFPVANKI